MRKVAIWPGVFGFVALAAACGDEPVAEPSEEPTTYYIRKVDLYRDIPKDICQSKDASFLNNLVQRVTKMMPAGTSAFDFKDFNAHTAFNGKGMEAIIRFDASLPDGESHQMFAIGLFEPADCSIGSMEGGTGGSAHGPDAKVLFREGMEVRHGR